MIPDRRDRRWLRPALTGAVAAAFLGLLTTTAPPEPSGRAARPAHQDVQATHQDEVSRRPTHRSADAGSPQEDSARPCGSAPVLGLLLLGYCGRTRVFRRCGALRRPVCSGVDGRTGCLCYLRVF
ncbi:hypothetical protein ACWGBH_31955 [Streptomyces massasporeus]